jgi:NTE family protein
VLRSARHAEPILDLSLFRIRSFTIANAAAVAYATSFFSMLLAQVLFLTSIWDYSVLRAGLAITPAPLSAGLVAIPAGRLAGRTGFRPPIVLGSLLIAGSLAWIVAFVGSQPAYLAEWLPMAIPLGAGVGIAFPMLNAASVSGLSPDRFAVGSAVHQVARQFGSVIGVAVLVAILGTPDTPAEATDRFDAGFLFGMSMALLAAVLALFLGGRRRPALA